MSSAVPKVRFKQILDVLERAVNEITLGYDVMSKNKGLCPIIIINQALTRTARSSTCLDNDLTFNEISYWFCFKLN